MNCHQILAESIELTGCGHHWLVSNLPVTVGEFLTMTVVPLPIQSYRLFLLRSCLWYISLLHIQDNELTRSHLLSKTIQMNSILLLGDMFILTHYSIHNLCINHVNQQKHHTNQISHEPNKQKKICLPNFVINKKTQQRERKKKFDCRPNQSESTESINRLSIHPSINQSINQYCCFYYYYWITWVCLTH